jgi:sulfate-transporting ATPase
LIPLSPLPFLFPHSQAVKDMIAEFEAISLKMGEPDADIDALSSKMDRMQVRA